MEWKALRSELIKAACEQCGETAGPMNLQHLWHPDTVTDIAHRIRDKHKAECFNRFVVESANDPRFQDRVVPDGPPRPGCPKCGGWVLKQRKSPGWKRFRCETTRQSRRCHFEFDEAVEVQPLAVDYGGSRQRAVFEVAYRPIYNDTNEDMLRVATIEAVRQFQQYMSGEGTATFCRRCAYMWDEKGLKLCVTCRDSWHEHFFKQCKACEHGLKWVTCKVCNAGRHTDNYPSCYKCAERAIEELDSIE